MRRNTKADAFLIGIIVLVALAIIACCLVYWNMCTNLYTVTGKVQKLWVDVGKDESFYMIRLEGGTMLEVDRNIFLNNPDTNSDRIFSGLEVGKTYKFTCWGWTNDWYYWYPNVVKAELVP